jgi:hypothetical protein
VLLLRLFFLNIKGRKLTNLRFADYGVLFANYKAELQEMVNEVTKLSIDGLQIDTKKTKVMTNSAEIEIGLNRRAYFGFVNV